MEDEMDYDSDVARWTMNKDSHQNENMTKNLRG